ncbi:early transcribed membrane protein, putative [Plasmodium knowlesi strain H]|uniref:Early transcribed membrane protein, putative n=2 Tax=Plasmodium knowlesi (strain H) TaxID=5851 RepID=A0A5K1TZ66_PLAKH|nr:early transcribed membrane protein [Plasmodium knowlesi strain H]CAA9987061.1 early transcribed membrane protein [Plasmodium knowlesi strain H]SBO23781.1 early transcribed membrane protein, putative [Plasmodium knowlesi strain H]SBO25506.1 early transcribed membrane protein, putative [Plasmodium knowlesi strain H]VVS76535.1 early transcribed membrane protein [Plasmodium knowlesi strain H]|eukprot:XP_002261684.1 early transcribed membrane protein, putative [Plasmodium knowlesi strain H]
MKITKLLALFAILPIVCLCGNEEVDVISQNDKLKKEDLDVDTKIKKHLQKRKLMMMSMIAAAVLAVGGILGGVGYGIAKQRKKARMEEDEPFTDILEDIHPQKNTTSFKMTSETIIPEINVSIPEATGHVSPLNVEMEDIDGDTGERMWN